MTWLNALLFLAQLLSKLMQLAEQNKWVKEGELQGASETMELTLAKLKKASTARDAAPTDGELRDDDPYLRKD